MTVILNKLNFIQWKCNKPFKEKQQKKGDEAAAANTLKYMLMH